MDTFPPRPPRGDPSDPLGRIPETAPAAVRIDTRNNFHIPLPDLVVSTCDLVLPPIQENGDHIDVLEWPENFRQHFHHLVSFGSVTAEIINSGNAAAGTFSVHVTVGIADWVDATNQFEWRGRIVVRERMIAELAVGATYRLIERFIPIGRITNSVYIAVVEVNPITDDHPLGKVIESNYVNNRCGCTWYDHPGPYSPGESHIPDEPQLDEGPPKPPEPPIRPSS